MTFSHSLSDLSVASELCRLWDLLLELVLSHMPLKLAGSDRPLYLYSPCSPSHATLQQRTRP